VELKLYGKHHLLACAADVTLVGDNKDAVKRNIETYIVRRLV
jgi:hypothetical protein